MLIVTNLSKAYGTQTLFDEASFTVGPGERLGLVGRNGTGKTTLFRMILGEEEPDSGEIHIPRGYTIRHLSQHISFVERSVLAEACLNLTAHEDGRDETYRAKTILAGLGFAQADLDRDPRTLSGGFQVRLNLAKILIARPMMLLLDEPTNYLDIVSIRWLTQFLKGWKGEMVLITHDRDFMDSVTTHTMVIHRGRIRKMAGTTHKLYDQIIEEEEVYEQTRVNEEKKRREIELFISRFRAQATRARSVQSRIRQLQKKEKMEKLATMETLEFSFNAAPFPGRWLLEADGARFSYGSSGPELIRDFSIAIKKRDRIGVIGKNGKGKTTLLNLLAGGLAPVSGTITHNQNLKLGYFGQMNIDRLEPEMTIEDEIWSVQPDRSKTVVRGICGAMLFDGDKALKKIGVLSGGERSRVLMGKLIAEPANLLLLDEPTNHLDMESIDSLIEAINDFEGAVVIVTHSEMILDAVAERLIVFDGSRVSVFEGSYEDFLARVGWEDEAREGDEERETTAAPAKSVLRKESKRLRAEIVNDRSRALTPIKNRINEIETAITEAERQLAGDNKALIAASRNGDGKIITDLSVAIHEAKIRIDELFDELEVITTQHDALAQEFEERLREI
ncbi:MAG TPA: ABC-F family ATP-binding cassette domain-containing protein [Syntrophorhabdaceae bacterium]|nr:ABC-F family ATP-binding cassette domain-containing protein [Syntrophorhabdaceae bacterium]